MKFTQTLKKLGDKFLDALYPNNFKCTLCGKDIPNDDKFCKKCKNLNIFNIGNRCVVCDTQIKEGNIICDNCKSFKKPFVKCFCPLVYDDKVRSAIIKLKDDGAAYLVENFASLIYERLLKENIDFDIIVPVPSHKKTIKKRGYNPAKLIANQLSLLTQKPMKEILVKNVLSPKQKTLNFQERQTNLENTMYLTDKNEIKGKTILLVDDIITTCATMTACTNLCKGAKKVYACAIAKTQLK